MPSIQDRFDDAMAAQSGPNSQVRQLRALLTEARDWVEATTSTIAKIAPNAVVGGLDLLARIDRAVAHTTGLAQPLDLGEFPIVGDVKITGGDKSEEPIPFD